MGGGAPPRPCAARPGVELPCCLAAAFKTAVGVRGARCRHRPIAKLTILAHRGRAAALPPQPSRGLYQSRRAADAELPSPKVLQRSLVWRRRARGGVAQIKRVLVKLASEPGGKGPVYESRELGAPPPPGGRGSGAGWLVGPAVGRMRL